MKDLFLRFCRWVLPMFGVTAVISCDNVIQGADMYGTQVAEYGVPVMEFRVSGKVVNSKNGEPVKDIAVTYIENEIYEHEDTVRTSSDGSFVYQSLGFPSDKVKLKFTDMDLEANGGHFKTKEMDFTLEKEKEGDGWDYGYYSADDVKVELSE